MLQTLLEFNATLYITIYLLNIGVLKGVKMSKYHEFSLSNIKHVWLNFMKCLVEITQINENQKITPMQSYRWLNAKEM